MVVYVDTTLSSNASEGAPKQQRPGRYQPRFDGVPFSHLVKEGVITPGAGPDDRHDPFYEMQWPTMHGGPEIAWSSLLLDRRQREMTGAPVKGPAYNNYDYYVGGRMKNENPREVRKLLGQRRDRLEALAAINLWRNVTGTQLAAFTGCRTYTAPRSGAISFLYQSGLVHRGRFTQNARPLPTYPEVYRPAPEGPKDLPDLNYGQWLGVTLGREPIRGRNYNRHNLLTVEASLRCAEMTPIRAVLGEPASEWSVVFHDDLKPGNQASDAVWVRDDGLRICVELVGRMTPTIPRKLERVAEILARDTSRSVVFLFLVAGDGPGARTNSLNRYLRQNVRKAGRSTMEAVLAGVQQRIFVARWDDWFPSPGHVAREFVSLRSCQYHDESESWIDVDLLDPFAVPFERSDDPANIETLERLPLVLGAPHWLRRPVRNEFDGYLQTLSGIRDNLTDDEVADIINRMGGSDV
jgi:hypothetical protein